MPSSAVRRFSYPDEYSASIWVANVEVLVTGRGQFSAELARIDLHDLRMQHFSESLPRIAHSVDTPDRAIVAFSTDWSSGNGR